MSLAKAQRHLLERLGAGSTVLLSIHLALPAAPGWADGVDADGRAVFLVGRHQLEAIEQGPEAIAAVLEALRAGHMPEGVHGIAYARRASEAVAEVVAGAGDEVLIDGPRGTGKTQLVPAALAALAERHARAGFALPLRASWLHDSLLNASVKTAASLEEVQWGGLWDLRADRHRAVLTVAGVELVIADFVGCRDETAAERLRASAHVIAAEELVPSLDESGGIEERKYDLARSSLLRLPAHRRVAVSTTNPGDVDTWPYRRWIEGGGRSGCVRCEVPAEDRLTPEEIAALRASFRDSPDLERRLALGEWSALKLGELVAEGYDPALHVAPTRMVPDPGYVLVIGWDGGRTPSAVVGQMIDGQVRVYAAFNRTEGVEELAVDEIAPWLETWAPWARTVQTLMHVIDPSMRTKAEASRRISSEHAIRDTLGGRIAPWPRAGQDPWPPRREAVVRVVGPRLANGKVALQVNLGAETVVLRHALASRWIYPRTPDGRTDRSGPKKPNSPHADVGDAFAYLCGFFKPGMVHEPKPPGWRPPPSRTHFDLDDYVGPRASHTEFDAFGRRSSGGLGSFFRPKQARLD